MLALALATSAPQPLLIRAYDAATVSFIARATANGGRALTVPEKVAFDDFVLWCKAYGIWSTRDAMFPLFAIDDATSRTSLVNGTYTLTKSATAPVFTAGRGWAGALTPAFLQSNFTPSTAGGNYSLNSSSMTIHVETGTGNSAIGGGNNCRFTANQSLGVFGGRINDGTTLTGAACGDIQDVLGYDRSAAGALSRYRGGVKYSVDTTASTSLDVSPWTFCGNDGIGAYSDARLGFVGWGASMTDVQHAALREGIKRLAVALSSPITFSRSAVDDIVVGTRPAGGAYRTQNAAKAWSYAQDGAYERFELRDGDLWSGTERSEVVLSGVNFVNNVDMAWSDTIRWSGVQSGIWHVQGQFHGPDTGGTAGYSPVIALDIDNNGVLSLEINYNIGAGQVFQTFNTGITLSAGRKYNRFVRFLANPATPGSSYAHVYLDGVLVYSKTNTNIGFVNDGGVGSYFKEGVYRDAATGNTTEIWDYWNREVDTYANLSGRIAAPLPAF